MFILSWYFWLQLLLSPLPWPDFASLPRTHQFGIKLFSNNVAKDVVLLHYKSWVSSKYWLPSPVTAKDPAVLSLAEENLTTHISNSAPSKKPWIRIPQRGKTTLGQKSSHLRLKLKCATGSASNTNFQPLDQDNGHEDAILNPPTTKTYQVFCGSLRIRLCRMSHYFPFLHWR